VGKRGLNVPNKSCPCRQPCRGETEATGASALIGAEPVWQEGGSVQQFPEHQGQPGPTLRKGTRKKVAL
jgi:hypothetical protein